MDLIPNKKMYFTEEHQRAVIEYKKSKDPAVRNYIYNTFLYKPFKNMANAILFRYPTYIGREGTESLILNCLTHLAEKFESFDEWKPNKLDIEDFEFDEPSVERANVSTNHYGAITRITSQNPAFEEYLQKFIGVETIYINEKVVLEAVLKIIKDKKVSHCYLMLYEERGRKYTRDVARNEKYLIDYYRLNIPDIEEAELKKRLMGLKYGFYLPIKEERKAFSYCQTIVRNFYKTHSKESYADKFNNLEMTYGDDSDREEKEERGYDIIDDSQDAAEIDHLYEKILERTVDLIQKEIDTNEFLTENERNIGMMLCEALKNYDRVFDAGQNIKKIFLSMTKGFIDPKKGYSKSLKRFTDIYQDAKAEMVLQHHFTPKIAKFQ